MQILKGLWALTVPLLLALLTAIVSGTVAALLVVYRVGIDGHLSIEDKHEISHTFFGPIFAVFNKTSFVEVEPGW